MRSLKLKIALPLLGAVIGLAILPAWAGNTTYVPAGASQTVEQGESSLEMLFNATSPVLPTRGRTRTTPYTELTCDSVPGVSADVIAKDMSFTDPDTLVTAPFDFSSWFVIDPTSWCFTESGQPLAVSIFVDVPFDAMVGQYNAKVVANGPNGIGWGEGSGFQITLYVIEPTSTDVTPPVVSILEPALDGGNPQPFILGNRVDVDFTAEDPDSPVSGWTADLLPGPVDVSGLLGEAVIPDGIEVDGFILTGVPGGFETIDEIGLYTLSVTATSDGGTSAPETRDFTVNYHISPLGPSLNVASLVWVKSLANQGACGSANPKSMQVKFEASAVQPADTELLDNNVELFVRDQTVLVEIVRNSDSVVRFSRTYTGGAAGVSVTISDSTGAALPGPNYKTDVNLCAETIGTYTINVYYDDHSGLDFLQFTKQFTLQN